MLFPITRFSIEMDVNKRNTIILLYHLGGGATGTDTGDVWPGDGYVKNWLNFLTVSTGFVYQF